MADLEARLLEIVLQNRYISETLDRASFLEMPNWYLGAGCISQSVWNELSGLEISKNIKDYDLVYFDAKDLSYEAEDIIIQKSKKLFEDLPIDIEIRNQARVHLWYPKKFGREIPPYVSVEDSISTWPTTATSVGIRKFEDNYSIYAPYGLEDLFSKTVRANKRLITEEIFYNKANRWLQYWKDLKIIEWDQ